MHKKGLSHCTDGPHAKEKTKALIKADQQKQIIKISFLFSKTFYFTKISFYAAEL